MQHFLILSLIGREDGNSLPISLYEGERFPISLLSKEGEKGE